MCVTCLCSGIIKYNLYFLLDIELNALRQNDFAGIIQAACRSSHILLPRIRTGLASPTGRLVTAECATDFGAIGGRIQIDNTSVGTIGTLELGPGLGVVGENRR